MAQVTFEALVDWLAEEANAGENHSLELLPIPVDGAPNASDFFSMLTTAIGDLRIQGDTIDRESSEWLVVPAFGMLYVYSYEYDVFEAVRTMADVHEFIDATEEDAEEESRNLRDTYESLRRDLD